MQVSQVLLGLMPVQNVVTAVALQVRVPDQVQPLKTQ
jgi:hypothetical protein